jgi:hypothetical protein
MFNFRGDNNGRHNWTGRPMLDGVTGALFVLGFVLALSYWRRWEYALPLVWLPIALAGGILSLSWEAPQSHRAIDDVTAAALFAALPLGTLWRASDRLAALPLLGRATRASAADVVTSRLTVASVFSVVVVGLIGATAAVNVYRYFAYQQRDSRTWLEFSTPQTEAGRLINTVPAGWRVYVDPVFAGYPSMSFTIEQERELIPFDASAHLPIGDGGAAIFLSDRQPTLVTRIASLYPNAQRRALEVPEGGHIGLHSFWLTPMDVQGAQGVTARYGSGADAVERVEAAVDFPWPARTPLSPPFETNLYSTLAVRTYGPYRFRLDGPPDAWVELDGERLVAGGREAQVVLARGTHALRVEVPSGGEAPLRLLWAPPGGALAIVPPNALYALPMRTTGLLARLYRGSGATGEPAMQQLDPAVELRVHQLPLPRPYTIEWVGAIRFGAIEFQ